MRRLLSAIVLLAGCELAPAASPAAAGDAAAELTAAIDAYRAERGLPAVPRAPSLDAVAAIHLADLRAHPPDRDAGCILHSWSADGPWTACCYTGRPQAGCMTDKPRELTAYAGDGFELAARASRMSPALAVQAWRDSPAHDAVLANRGLWADTRWQAAGVAIDGEYALLWFGEEREP